MVKFMDTTLYWKMVMLYFKEYNIYHIIMLNILLSIVSYDIWFYISHLILHTNYFYSRIHYVHHAIKNPKFMDTYIGHFLESPFQGTV